MSYLVDNPFSGPVSRVQRMLRTSANFITWSGGAGAREAYSYARTAERGGTEVIGSYTDIVADAVENYAVIELDSWSMSNSGDMVAQVAISFFEVVTPELDLADEPLKGEFETVAENLDGIITDILALQGAAIDDLDSLPIPPIESIELESFARTTREEAATSADYIVARFVLSILSWGER